MMVISKISLSLFLLSIIIPCVFKLSRRQNGRKDFFFPRHSQDVSRLVTGSALINVMI